VGLPLVPLGRLQSIPLQVQDDVATRLLGVAEQEVSHVHAVDHPVAGDLRAGDLQQRCVPVDRVHELVADRPGRYLPGPPNDAGRPVRPLECGKQAAAPRS
jgi:hypothetical protein